MAEARKVKDEEDQDGAEQTPPPKKSSSVKIIIIVVIALFVLGGGGAGAYFFFFAKSNADEKKMAEKAKPKVAVYWPMEPFIVNLLDNEGERYLKIIMQLELSDQSVAEEFKILQPKIRDNILDLLTAKSYKDMMDPNGKQRLKDEIVMRANTFATNGKVLKVYFTEFVIQ